MPDPRAKETVANPFGGRNSVLRVGRLLQLAHLANVAIAPLKNIGD